MMKRYTLLTLLLLLCSLIKADETKLQVDVPENYNWMFFMPDIPPYITVTLTNPSETEISADVQLIVQTDMLADYKTFNNSKKVPGKGSVDLDFEFEAEPGFYQCTVVVNGEQEQSFRIGVDPEDIVAAPDYQPDFKEFWDKAKEELAGVEPRYTLTEIPENSTSERKVYLVEMYSVSDGTGEGITRGYYAEPTGEGTYPAVVTYEGYDMEDGDPFILQGDSRPGTCQLLLSPRGQLINNRPPYENPYGKWLTYGFGSQDTYYYRGAFMDAIRAIDFLCSREKVQKENIFAEGLSQGGALTFAAAALDDRLNAISPAIPFLGDFPNYLKMNTWPSKMIISKQQEMGMSDEETLKMLSYFDTKNLATMIKCPVYMYFSLQDQTCPPRTNFAPYNNLSSMEKTYDVGPKSGHSVPLTWNINKYAFFNKHIKEPSAIKDIEKETTHTTDAIYTLQGIRLKAKALKKGIYLKNGKKVIMR